MVLTPVRIKVVWSLKDPWHFLVAETYVMLVQERPAFFTICNGEMLGQRVVSDQARRDARVTADHSTLEYVPAW